MSLQDYVASWNESILGNTVEKSSTNFCRIGYLIVNVALK